LIIIQTGTGPNDWCCSLADTAAAFCKIT